MTTKWEYMTGECGPSPQQIQGVCTKVGADGWELCGMVSALKDMTGGMILKGVATAPPQPIVILTFKRPVGWERETSEDMAEDLASVGG